MFPELLLRLVLIHAPVGHDPTHEAEKHPARGALPDPKLIHDKPVSGQAKRVVHSPLNKTEQARRPSAGDENASLRLENKSTSLE